MKINYLLNLEIVSNNKFTNQELVHFKSEFESHEDLIVFSEFIQNSLNLNFSDHLEFYIENAKFDSDLSEEFFKAIKILERLIPGGCSSDSKMEWESENPNQITLWYKDGNYWKTQINKVYESYRDYESEGEESDWTNSELDDSDDFYSYED